MSTTTHAIPEAPWVVPGAHVVVLAGGWHGDDLSGVRTVDKVGKLHVVLDDGDRYGAKTGPGQLRRAAWKDAWRSAPRLVAADSDEAWRAWCERRVSSAASGLLGREEHLRKALQGQMRKPDVRAEAKTSAAEVAESLEKLRRALELDPLAKPEGWQGIPTP